MSKASIKDQTIAIRPSQKLIEFIKSLDDVSVELPENMLKVYQAFSQDTRPRKVCQQPATDAIGAYTEEERKLLIALSDDAFQGTTDLGKCLESLCLNSNDNENYDSDIETLQPDERISKNKARQLRAKQRQKEMSKLTLNLSDLKWLQNYLSDARKTDSSVPYLHEFIEGSQLILPANEIVERNPELEARCQRLKLEQDEQRYRQMTKNVDCTRSFEPEETISYQVKLMNRQLIAVAQFVFSVAAGFAFGFIGIELIVGNLDFGFRLLLGVICSLTIALAEIYFLAKKLNEEIDEAERSLNQPKSESVSIGETVSTSSKAQHVKEHDD